MASVIVAILAAILIGFPVPFWRDRKHDAPPWNVSPSRIESFRDRWTAGDPHQFQNEWRVVMPSTKDIVNAPNDHWDRIVIWGGFWILPLGNVLNTHPEKHINWRRASLFHVEPSALGGTGTSFFAGRPLSRNNGFVRSDIELSASSYKTRKGVSNVLDSERNKQFRARLIKKKVILRLDLHDVYLGSLLNAHLLQLAEGGSCRILGVAGGRIRCIRKFSGIGCLLVHCGRELPHCGVERGGLVRVVGRALASVTNGNLSISRESVGFYGGGTSGEERGYQGRERSIINPIAFWLIGAILGSAGIIFAVAGPDRFGPFAFFFGIAFAGVGFLITAFAYTLAAFLSF